jgi:hypothetical protein
VISGVALVLLPAKAKATVPTRTMPFREHTEPMIV